jgi:hypothetical protein
MSSSYFHAPPTGGLFHTPSPPSPSAPQAAAPGGKSPSFDGVRDLKQLPAGTEYKVFKYEGVGYGGENPLFVKVTESDLAVVKNSPAPAAGKEGGRGEYINELLGSENNESQDVLALSTRFFNRMDPLWEYTEKIQPIEGFQDIACHGDKVSFIFRDADGIEVNIPAHEFAEILKNSPVYEGRPIRLISCEAGADGSITAQYLADYLGVDIMAPTDTVIVFRDGKMIIGPDQFHNTGTWVIFHPKGIFK